MFVATSVYFVLFCVLWWGYAGYILFMLAFSIFSGGRKSAPSLVTYPDISVIVPVYNDASLVRAKIANIAATTYPLEKITVFIVDGGSDDASVAEVEIALQEHPQLRARLLHSPMCGKILQLNYARAFVVTPYIVHTDADAELAPDCLERLIAVLSADSETALVGAYVSPKHASDLEVQFWKKQNELRVLESNIHASSIVVAPCYAYRSDLLSVFPEDCVADDVYIAFLASIKGKKSHYLIEAQALEVRSPQDVRSLVRHKFRKSHAYIIELLRVFYLFPVMTGFGKVLFLTKCVQILLLPWLFPYFLVATLSFLLSGSALALMAVLLNGFLAVSLLLCHIFLGQQQSLILPAHGEKRSTILVFLLTNFILVGAAISYPFYRQNSQYDKVRS